MLSRRKRVLKVFHNHLSVDAIEPIFKFGSIPFNHLVEMLRVETISEAARHHISLVSTFCYAKGEDDLHVDRITKAVESNGGEIFFVLLKSTPEELKRRVVAESRRSFGKAKTVDALEDIFEHYDLFSPVPGRESLIIDNTNISAEEAAKQIIAWAGEN